MIVVPSPVAPLPRRSLAEKFREVHDALRREPPFDGLARISLALYDAPTDSLKTFVHSSDAAGDLEHYEARMAGTSLKQCQETGEPRVVNDLSAFGAVPRQHAQAMAAMGYRSSLTVPMRHNGRFFGFVFFNARQTGFFTPAVVHGLMVYAELLSLLVIVELNAVRTLQGAVKTAREMSRYRDEETGRHLDRMSRFARIIALGLAGRCRLSDEAIEFVFQFAPLHDIGKVGIPDEILLNPKRLTPLQREIMKTHVAKGARIVDTMVENFGLQSLQHIGMLRNVVACHHEAYDGTGYPHGLRGEDIPLEARITSVADVFDALTSKRPYKEAWSNAEALDFLRKHAGTKFDPLCVEALEANLERVEEVQARFAEDVLG